MDIFPSQVRRSLGTSMETDSVATPSVARQPQSEEAEAALRELQEQFEAYKKEKRENDAILNKQLDEMREQASTLRIDNAKLASKVQSGSCHNSNP